MFKRSILSLSLSIICLNASAVDYRVVIPVLGKSTSVATIDVNLNGTVLPGGMLGAPYPGYDFKPLLKVTGDPSYTGAGVKWSVVSGSLPAGLVLNDAGVLSGAPTAAGASSFQLQASYKTKTGSQTYQISVAAGCAPGELVLDSPVTNTAVPVPAGCSEVLVKAWGAGGGGGSNGAYQGGAGGYAGGTLKVAQGTVLMVTVGTTGAYDAAKSIFGGGGYTGVWLAGEPVLVAAGGGGGGLTGRGGAAGQSGEGLFGGIAASATAGGSGCNGANGTAWKGGVVQTYQAGYPAGNGGGGYYGGGGGCVVWYYSANRGGSGGGGSNFVAGTVQSKVSLYGTYVSPGNPTDQHRGSAGEPNRNGKLVISFR